MTPIRTFLSAIPLLLLSVTAQAASIDLYQWLFNIDGAIHESATYPVGGEPLPAEITGSLDASGLGTLSTSISGAGSHSFVAYFDFEIDEASNTYFNEFGSANGLLSAGQSWEIDEPFLVGDIYFNAIDAALDNTNTVPEGSNDDVAFALGWDFTLLEGQTATIDLILSDLLDTAGFYLSQTDTQTGAGFDETASIFFWSELTISGGPTVAEPHMLALLGLGLLGMGLIGRLRNDLSQ